MEKIENFAKEVIKELEKRETFPKGSIQLHEYRLPLGKEPVLMMEGPGYQPVCVNLVYKKFKKLNWTKERIIDDVAVDLLEAQEEILPEPPKQIDGSTVRAGLVHKTNPRVQEEWVIRQPIFDMILYFYYEGTGELWETFENRIERRDMEASRKTMHDLFAAAMDNLNCHIVKTKDNGMDIYHLDNAAALLSQKLKDCPELEGGFYVYPEHIYSVYLIPQKSLEEKYPKKKAREDWLLTKEGALMLNNLALQKRDPGLVLSYHLYWYQHGTLAKVERGTATEDTVELSELFRNSKN